jgi:hypothetical protein
MKGIKEEKKRLLKGHSADVVHKTPLFLHPFSFLAAAAAALHRYIYLDCTVTTAE